MKFLIAGLVFIVAGYFALKELRVKPAPPPPPPPAILLQPLPVIDEVQQAKIIRSANDPDPTVRWEALVFLDKMHSPKAMPLLFEKLKSDLEVEVRLKIVQLLSNRGNPEVIKQLVLSLKDDDARVRIATLTALDKIGDYTVAPEITESLKDPEESVRIQALRTLNNLQDKKAAAIAEERRRQEELRRQVEEQGKMKKKSWFSL
ncbi:MAG: HEAT repeat domain-containing protein [Elusimicrobia bacterium]|nr:HEAT repeat domain-containing protein [Elusimicrobiota bacterium]